MTILCELKKTEKVSVFGKWIPHDLSSEDSQKRVTCCKLILEEIGWERLRHLPYSFDLLPRMIDFLGDYRIVWMVIG